MIRTILLAEGAPYPQARIDSVDAESGVCLYAWLTTDGAMVDSGGSIARFTPVVQTPATDEAPAVYAEPDDAMLAAAISDQPGESLPQFIARATAAVQAMLDARAQAQGYDNILSAASYAGATGGIFAAEGAAFKAWRSAVWAACYAALGAHNPATPPPEMSAFLASLPAYVPPAS